MTRTHQKSEGLNRYLLGSFPADLLSDRRHVTSIYQQGKFAEFISPDEGLFEKNM